MSGNRHIHLHLTIQPGSTVHVAIGDDGHITAASVNGEPRSVAASDSASSDGTLTGARLEAAIQRLGRSGASPNARAIVEGLRSLGYQFLQSNKTDNYLRAIDPRGGTTAVAYLWPTYLDFTRYALQLAPGLASMPEAQPRDSGVKFLHIESVEPALDAARLYMEESSKAG
jgi:hypothetical protein